MLITTALSFGILMATILAVFVLVSLAQNPRIWAGSRSAPQILKDAIEPPLKDEEKNLLKLWAIPIFAVTLLMPLGAALWYEATYQPMSYGEAYLFVYSMWMVFNLVDLLIIDWLVLVWWQPAWSFTPEVKPLLHHVGYSYHFKGFLKGTVMLGVFALLYAGILMLV